MPRWPAIALGLALGVLAGTAPGAALEDVAADRLDPAPLDMSDPATCLGLAMYWESKGEGEEGMLAVGSVVLNRAESTAYPDEVCAVVTQGGETPPCQFSFWCDGLPDQPVEAEAWTLAGELAARLLAEQPDDPTGGALFYHATTVTPDWAADKEHTVQIGGHLYYR